MTNQEILTKAIEKASGIDTPRSHFAYPLETMKWNDEHRYWYEPGYESEAKISLFEIIYQHGFAKALWGEEILIRPFEDFNNDSSRYYLPNWQYHLQQMVLAEDPIRYLGEHLN